MDRGRPDKRDVHLVMRESLTHVVAERLLEGERHQRKGFPKGANDPWHKGMKQSRRRNAYAQSALLTSSRAAGRFQRAAEMAENCSSILQERASGFGQFNAARLAAKELNIKLAFDRFDPLAERRLLHAKPFGGACDMSFLRDRDEIPEILQVHCIFKRYEFRCIHIIARLPQE
jgi:hypothetical protein